MRHRIAPACGFAALLLSLVGDLPGLALQAQVPPRSEAGQTLAVPEAHLDLGQLYYLTPGEDTQLAVRSDAPLQRLVATTSRAVGYVVTPFELDEASTPLLAGAIRLPVASLRTAAPRSDETLLGGAFLDKDNHPEVTFLLTGVKEVVAGAREGEVFTYGLDLVGRLTVKGVEKEVKVPAQATFLPSSRRTMGRFVGDMLTLEGQFEIRPEEDFGWKPPHPSFAERIAATLTVDFFFLLNTVSPDKSLDPRLDPKLFAKELRFLTLLRDLDDPTAAYAHGRAYLKEVWDDAQALRRMATMTVTEPDVETRDLAFALQAARRASELTGGSDASILATVAQVYSQMGDLDAAVKWQQRAADHLEGVSPNVAQPIRAALERYTEEQKARHEEGQP